MREKTWKQGGMEPKTEAVEKQRIKLKYLFEVEKIKCMDAWRYGGKTEKV